MLLAIEKEGDKVLASMKGVRMEENLDDYMLVDVKEMEV